MPACSASPIFYSQNFAALGYSATEINVNNAWLHTAWARELVRPERQQPASGLAAARRAPLKPMLRPLARKVCLSPSLGAQAETILRFAPTLSKTLRASTAVKKSRYP
jgi:hypothetical protein